MTQPVEPMQPEIGRDRERTRALSHMGKCYLALGGTRSLLGFPISVEKKAAVSPQGTEGWYQDFEGGTLHWTDKYGGIAILGEIAKVYSHFDGSGGKFGFPTASEEEVEGKPNLRTQQFEGGVICIMHEEK